MGGIKARSEVWVIGHAGASPPSLTACVPCLHVISTWYGRLLSQCACTYP